MNIKEVHIGSPLEVKIRWAENCYQERRDQLLEDIQMSDLLDRYREAIQASHEEMSKAGVVKECRDCEEREGGSCCGIGLENRYSGILLLINLLLDVKIPTKRQDTSSCFFLGERGCRLLARHVICVNYLCKKITEHIDPKKIAALREKEGVELEHLFFLQERIRKILRDFS
jgi:hypothetical protein